MGRSLSLAAYRALSWRRYRPANAPLPSRPGGELLWLHATGPQRLAALRNLGARLRALRPGLNLLVTVDRARVDVPAGRISELMLPLAPDHPVMARQFLDHWRPDICLWTGGDLMPNLITQAASRGLPMILADMGADEVPARRSRWLPDLARTTLNSFDTVLVRDAATAAALIRSGVVEGRVRVTSRLRTSANPPPCNDDDLARIGRDLAGRPVWLAAGAQMAEIDTILDAHRAALRLIHRLLLVVTPADPAAAAALHERLAAAGLRVGSWDDGNPVSDDLQVLVSADPAELGLWYRAAPMTLVASTFERGEGGRNPFEAAGLGSAILHGPNTRDFSDAFRRLTEAGATCEVRTADQLGAEVIRLAAPEQAARVAIAAWDVATEGAALTDNLIDLVQDLLDLREQTDAGT